MKQLLLLSLVAGLSLVLSGCGGGAKTPGLSVAEDFIDAVKAGEEDKAEEMLHPFILHTFEARDIKFGDEFEKMEEDVDEDEEFELIDYDVSENGRNATYVFSYDNDDKSVRVQLKEFKGDFYVLEANF
jgi:hypothetical protein